jgi:hypothetical protein
MPVDELLDEQVALAAVLQIGSPKQGEKLQIPCGQCLPVDRGDGRIGCVDR